MPDFSLTAFLTVFSDPSGSLKYALFSPLFIDLIMYRREGDVIGLARRRLGREHA